MRYFRRLRETTRTVASSRGSSNINSTPQSRFCRESLFTAGGSGACRPENTASQPWWANEQHTHQLFISRQHTHAVARAKMFQTEFPAVQMSTISLRAHDAFIHGEALSVLHACRHPRLKLPTLHPERQLLHSIITLESEHCRRLGGLRSYPAWNRRTRRRVTGGAISGSQNNIPLTSPLKETVPSPRVPR